MNTHFIANLTSYLVTLGHTLPLPLFVIVGSVIEEIISPVPATLILGVAGSVVALKGSGLLYLGFLTLLATLGKTFAAWATYWVGRLLGRWIIRRFGHLLNINYATLVATSRKLERHKRSWGWIFGMRALPVAPSGAISLAAGVIYLHQRVFVSATFAGYIFRNILTAATGFFGLDLLLNWDEHISNPLMLGLFIALAVTIALFYASLHYRRLPGSTTPVSRPPQDKVPTPSSTQRSARPAKPQPHTPPPQKV